MSRGVVAIFGSARPAEGSAAYQLAYELGHALATAGFTVCNGGYGGTMEASARGAVDANGHTIGITCSILPMRGGANAYIREEVATSRLLDRLEALIGRSDAYILLPGGTGTLLELSLVWELINKRLIDHKPLVLLGDHWQPVLGPIFRETPNAHRPILVQSVDSAVSAVSGALPR